MTTTTRKRKTWPWRANGDDDSDMTPQSDLPSPANDAIEKRAEIKAKQMLKQEKVRLTTIRIAT